MNGQLTNWAGNVKFQAKQVSSPSSLAQLQALVARTSHIRALGTRHSFNGLADSAGVLVSLEGLPPVVEIDSAAATVKVAAGVRYAELAPLLEQKGFALRNLASLPHISVAGACATATHGSGVRNGSLATAVSELELVTAAGDVVLISRADHGDQFNGAVVSLGALGVVASLTLDLVPSFDMRQHVYEGLPLEVLDDHFYEIVSSAYSVCLFTDWRGSRLTQIWINQRDDEPDPWVVESPWFTATSPDGARHPVAGLSPISCTEQLGVPGRWLERLPHFRPDFAPSSGEELQSEYLIPRQDAVDALHELDIIGEEINQVLQICEVRTAAADEQWLSPCYRQDTVSIHFTWTADAPAVLLAVALVEKQLDPFRPRPHWAKIFTTPPEIVRSHYERLPDFRDLMRHYDPGGKFRNAFIDKYLGIE
jgi:alditol oxidase